MVDLTEDSIQFKTDTKKWRRGSRGAPGQAFEGAEPSTRSKKTGDTEENRRRHRQYQQSIIGLLAEQPQKEDRPLTDFDRKFSNALDKKLKADPGQITDKFLSTMYSNYRRKIEEGVATQEGYDRLQSVIFKYADVTPSSTEGMPPEITHKYLGTKKGGRIKKRKNTIKKNYSRGGGVRSANY